MNSSTFPPPFRSTEGRTLAGPVPPAFEAFYRECLRFRTGERVGSVELRTRYLAWAEESGSPALSFLAIRRAMENVGHAHRTSNGVYYADATFAEAVPCEPDNFPAPPPIVAGEAAALVARLDRMAGELSHVRAGLVRLSGERMISHG